MSGARLERIVDSVGDAVEGGTSHDRNAYVCEVTGDVTCSPWSFRTRCR